MLTYSREQVTPQVMLVDPNIIPVATTTQEPYEAEASKMSVTVWKSAAASGRLWAARLHG